ncbi:AlpA family phage regulatory protein [Agrobacterium sp. CNPSo 2736]|uniref:helix-turn-helix transcriptional regulator n=1 Tax=Agrobacterium sp. CNPSo 2736 TaxID=2499627 RepID=UPI00196B9477|nr:AlpA family phage regulatory protein [Agrobacterium sp. CNPSo 2736]
MNESLMRVTDVSKVTTLSRAEIYRRVKAGTFPAQTRISHRVSAWNRTDIERWIAQKTRRSVDLSDLLV